MGKPKKRGISRGKALNTYSIEEGKGIRQHNLDEIEVKKNKYHVDEINSEEDEEIYSDDAYCEIDEITASSKNKQEDLDYSDIESELMQEGFIDLSEMLEDKSANKENKVDSKQLMKYSSEEEEQKFEFSDEEEEEDAVDKLDTFMENIKPQDRIKKYLNEKQETYKEDEFNLGSTTNVKDSKKLNLLDLLAPVSEEATFNSLEKKVASLTKKKKVTLEAPKAKRIQDRITRKAAQLEANDRISTWSNIISQNRAADHLNFAKEPIPLATTTSLTSQIKPETSMEKEIEAILVKSQLKEKEIQKEEELKMVELNPEEVLKRQKELSKLRELMFRNEAKAKRASKIKSKAYRKVHKKEKEKNLALQKELNGSDSEDELDAEVARARERMTLKHKNTSKWAKSLLKHGGNHNENQQAIQDQLNEHRRLTKKIQGIERSSDEEESEISSEEEENAFNKEKSIKQLDKLIQDSEQPISKGVMGMKFMQNAMAKKQKELEDKIEQDKKDLLLLEQDEFGNYLINPEKDDVQDNKVQGNTGRLLFDGDKRPNKVETKPKDKVEFNEHGQVKKVSQNQEHITKLSGGIKVSQKEENPWLQEDTVAVKKKRVTNNNNNEMDKSIKNSNKLKKAKTKNKVDDNSVQIDIDDVIIAENQNSDPEVEIDNEQKDLIPVEKDTAFTQKELIQLAFADDHVVTEFEQEKQKVIEEEAPQLKDDYLPGWGSWGGHQTKKYNEKQLKEFKIKKNLIKINKQGIDKEERKDKQLNNVIINEKTNAKLLKYTLRKVPFPYQNQQQYEMALKNPIGKEWNTTTVYSKKIKPEVITKKGQIINPLKMKDH